MTFQDIILELERFWAAQGCVVLQPYDSEVGAGTFHPATTLRSLGPGTWKTAYVQPSRRPSDGRYGENPNRLQHYYQFQVVIKPSPANILELYLDSLKAIGIEPRQHDVRFVEDDWESPTLGAWGLGWEVWLNGMEVTQFTYFQQVGGIDCDPIPVEITYGLERLAMYIQGVDSVYDLIWSVDKDGTVFTYGDVFLENEIQFSTYNFEYADINMLLNQFDAWEAECSKLLAVGLVLPAYDCVLKCSHLFNLLDARRAISTTERMGYILRVRTLAKGCCEAYVQLPSVIASAKPRNVVIPEAVLRATTAAAATAAATSAAPVASEVATATAAASATAALPAEALNREAELAAAQALAAETDELADNSSAVISALVAAQAAESASEAAIATMATDSSGEGTAAATEPLTSATIGERRPSTLIFEIGVEEIPSTLLYKATEQLKDLAEAAFAEARITHGTVSTYSTPRRIVLEVKRVAPETVALVQRFRGPAARIAYDANGQPTQAAEGFARGKGMDVRDLTRAVEGGTEYVFATVEQLARKIETVLPEVLSNLIEALEWSKSQRWGSGSETFARPVRWLLALWADAVLPAQFGQLTADRITYGHRLLAPEAISVAHADQYASALTKAWVISSADMRAGHIRAQIKRFEEENELFAYTPRGTFDEVVNLIEFPTTLVASFDEAYLEVPEEILIDTLLSHQRYFPVYNAERKLTNNFLVVSNGSPSFNSDIAAGHEKVVRPRLSDAVFFYREDLKTPLADRVAQLDQMVFHEKLGSLKDKTDRLVQLTQSIADQATQNLIAEGQDISQEQIDRATRAAYLCKADLLTNAVVEYTALQGIMGDHYAQAAGEPAEVAQAIREHYRPRFANDLLPANFEGTVVALADKIDTIAGLFAIGQLPTGSSDPFALRRNAIGIIAILQSGFKVSLESLIDQALNTLESSGVPIDKRKTKETITDFFAGRLSVIVRERGFNPDLVDAVMATGTIEPVEVLTRVEALTAVRNSSPDLIDSLATAYTRANNLRDASLGVSIDKQQLGEPELVLLAAIEKVDKGVASALESNRYDRALEYLATLKDPIDRFFDEALIMDPDETVRANRLRLLNCFVQVFADVADIGKLARA